MFDQRKYTRHHTELPVSFSGDQVSDYGMVVDLSVGGCRVKSTAAVFSGEFLGMLITLPGRDLPLAIGLATVRWSIGQEFGVEFIRMEPDQQMLLHRLIQKLESAVGSPPGPAVKGSPRPIHTHLHPDREQEEEIETTKSPFEP